MGAYGESNSHDSFDQLHKHQKVVTTLQTEAEK